MMEIDWGNSGFLRLYGLVFGLATVLTMIMWLISVVKRVVRGVPIGQAAMENVGYLLMSVFVAGFAPVVVAYTVDFVDAAAWAILGDYLTELFTSGVVIFTLLIYISTSMPGVGLVITIPILMMLIFSLFGLWIMLVVRNALILLGLVFGPLVFSGLVDKDLWGHTRKWVGMMGGIIVSKLAIFLALALAGAMLDGATDVNNTTLPQAIGACITFLALIFLALMAPFQVAKWLPFVGDEIQSMHQAKGEAAQRHRSAKGGMDGAKKDNDELKQRAASKSSAGGGEAGAGAGGASAAAGPAAAPMAVKGAADGIRDQAVEAASDGANNASGDGGQQGDASGGSQSKDGGGQGGQGGGGGGGSGGGGGGRSGGSTARRPVSPPPSSGPRTVPPPPPAPGPAGGQGAPPPAPAPVPPPAG